MRSKPPLRAMLVVESLLAAAVLAIIAAPLSLSEGTMTGLDGTIGSIDNWDDVSELPFPQMVVYLMGDAQCHQEADRSFELNANQMPFCARDLGLFSGAALGLLAYIMMRRNVPWAWLLLPLVPMAIDGGLQAISAYESNNALRALTGMVAGLAIGWGAGMLIDRFFGADNEATPAPEEHGQA